MKKFILPFLLVFTACGSSQQHVTADVVGFLLEAEGDSAIVYANEEWQGYVHGHTNVVVTLRVCMDENTCSDVTTVVETTLNSEGQPTVKACVELEVLWFELERCLGNEVAP